MIQLSCKWHHETLTFLMRIKACCQWNDFYCMIIPASPSNKYFGLYTSCVKFRSYQGFILLQFDMSIDESEGKRSREEQVEIYSCQKSAPLSVSYHDHLSLF